MSRFRFRRRHFRPRDIARADHIPLRAIVPNLVTSLAACAGITSITLSSEGRWLHALIALLVACLCDGIDGRIARLLNASSKLGAELDSLADFVNFGVAPAMFMYFWLINGLPYDPSAVMRRMILSFALFYAMCDAFRLARFNTMLETPTLPYWKNFFLGVPAPGGAWMVLTPALLSLALGLKGKAPALAEFLQNPYFGSFMLFFVGSLMASRLPTISLKSIHIRRAAVMPVIAGLLLLIAFLVANFWLTLGVVGGLYILSVPFVGLIFLRTRAAYERRNPGTVIPAPAPAAPVANPPPAKPPDNT